jgi:hypothetical protein
MSSSVTELYWTSYIWHNIPPMMTTHFIIWNKNCKEGWYASNHRDETPQMIQWLSKREKVASFKTYLQMTMEDEEGEFAHSKYQDQHIRIAKHPSRKNQKITDIIDKI